MANETIKSEIKQAGLRHWEIADSMGITDCTFSKKLRKELSEQQKDDIRLIINQLKDQLSNVK